MILTVLSVKKSCKTYLANFDGSYNGSGLLFFHKEKKCSAAYFCGKLIWGGMLFIQWSRFLNKEIITSIAVERKSSNADQLSVWSFNQLNLENVLLNFLSPFAVISLSLWLTLWRPSSASKLISTRVRISKTYTIEDFL